MGMQTRTVLSGASGPADLARASADYAATHGKSAGNGSLMRTGPVALAHLGDDQALVRAAGLISSLTHDDPLAKEACAICVSPSTGHSEKVGSTASPTESPSCPTTAGCTGWSGSPRLSNPIPR